MTSSNDALEEQRREVERLIGRCLLRLQRYERLMKVIVAEHKVSGTVDKLEAARDARREDTAGKTLGALVGEFLGSYVFVEGSDQPDEESVDSSDEKNSISLEAYMGVSQEDYGWFKIDLKEFVKLRNNLVHHFLDQHRLATLEGCEEALMALREADGRIGRSFEQLREWAKDFKNARKVTARILETESIREFTFNGIAPDGTVHWPIAGIGYALRRAFGDLEVDGWASVEEAGAWVSKHEPEQQPEKYGCSSWRQVVHESGDFELRYFERLGKRRAFYRESKD